MASPLTVITAGTSGRALGSQTAAETGGDVLGVFADLLGGTTAGTTTTSATNENQFGPGAASLFDLAFGFGEDQAGDTENPDAIAAAIDAKLPVAVNAEASAAFADLVGRLASLKAQLDAGEPLDPEELQALDAALEDLAASLDIDLASVPALDDLKALLAGAEAGDLSIAAQLSRALGPLAETLLAGDTTSSADMGALLKSIGDKMAALLASLNGDVLDPDKLAALGLGAEAPIDADLEAAIAKLTAAPAALSPPTLATPELKLAEPALTGKGEDGAQAPIAVANTEADAEADPQAGSGAGDKSQARFTIAPSGTAETTTETVTAGQTQHQASRVDAVAAPRVIQAGYQTSQQQLNLPQLAFELVRQVNDGNTRFQIRLDPPELGKIDVRLDIDQTGQVTARLTVEKAETLDLMQRDQRGLERALQQAGLDGAKTNLEFSLKQNPFSGGQEPGRERKPGAAVFGGTADEAEEPAPTVNLYRGSLTARGINIIA